MPMELRVGERVEMKKPHPCGVRVWTVTRVGMDVKLRCTGCGREAELPRAKAERGIRRVFEGEASGGQ